MKTCAREDCGHDRVMHPRGGACRQPGCVCPTFVAGPPPPPTDDVEQHAHRWQPAGVLVQGNQIAALCPCGAVIRLRLPDEPANA